MRRRNDTCRQNGANNAGRKAQGRSRRNGASWEILTNERLLGSNWMWFAGKQPRTTVNRGMPSLCAVTQNIALLLVR